MRFYGKLMRVIWLFLFSAFFTFFVIGCTNQNMPVALYTPKEKVAIPPDNFKNLVRLIGHPSDDMYPEVSPDGKLVVYTAKKNKTTDIFYFNPYAKRINVVQVTRHIANDDSPTWSPDGRYIFFSSSRLKTLSIWKTKIKGGRGLNQISLRENINDFDPDISPRGSKMVFSSLNYQRNSFLGSSKSNDPTLWTSDIGGYRVVQIGTGRNPKWSPDGKHILFHAMTGDNYDIWMINADGTNLTQLTTDSADDIDASWSPNGNMIVFSSNREGTLGVKTNFDIWAMDLNSVGITQLTFNLADDGAPSWSKDGTIYFHSNRDTKNRNYDIFAGTPILDWD